MRKDLAFKIIKERQTATTCRFRERLGFKSHDAIDTKEQTVLPAIEKLFEGENMKTQYGVLDYRINLYFHDYKLAIEVGVYGHCDRDIDYEIQRQKTLKRELMRAYK